MSGRVQSASRAILHTTRSTPGYRFDLRIISRRATRPMANVAPEPVVRTGLTAGGSEIRTLGPPTAVSSVVAPSTRSSLRDKGAGAGAGVQQTTDLLINAPHIKCWSSCPVTWGPRSRSIHARSRAATSRTRWTRRRSRRRVRASRRPAGDVSDLSDEEVRKIDLASAMF